MDAPDHEHARAWTRAMKNLDRAVLSRPADNGRNG
jgi:hypothetical protein